MAWRTVDNIAELVAHTIDLLAIELDDDDGVVLQELDVRQLNLGHVQQRSIRKLALQRRSASLMKGLQTKATEQAPSRSLRSALLYIMIDACQAGASTLLIGASYGG